MSASIKAGLNNDMHLMTDGVTRVYIDSDGNVGIGTNSPGALLSIPAGESSTPRFAIESATDNNDFTITQYEDGNGTYTMLGQNVKLNSGGNNTVSDAAHKTAGIQFDARNHGALTFVTGAANTATENMQISSAGHVTTPNQPTFSIFGDTNPNYTSDVIYIGHTGSGAAAFDTNIGNHFSYTNGKFTAPVAGSYFFSFRATTADTQSHFIDFYKNGARVGGHTLSYGNSYITATNTAVLTLASGDYIEARRRATGYSLYSVNFSGFLIG